MSQPSDLYLLQNGVYTKVMPEYIVYVRSFDNYCRFFMIGGDVFVVRMTLKNVGELLLAHGFIRCHRQFVINSKSVISLDVSKREMCLSGGHLVPYSRRKKGEVLNRILNKK